MTKAQAQERQKYYHQKFLEKNPNYNVKYLAAKKLGLKYSAKINHVRLTDDPEYQKKYYQKNREHIIAQKKQWSILHQDQMKAWRHSEHGRNIIRKLRVKYKEAKPYLKTLCNIRHRCNNQNDSKYRYYGGKGIRTLLTMEDLRMLWERDNASKMEQPSIDRVDSNGHYTLENCRFIEMKANRIRRYKIVQKSS